MPRCPMLLDRRGQELRQAREAWIAPDVAAVLQNALQRRIALAFEQKLRAARKGPGSEKMRTWPTMNNAAANARDVGRVK